ncbi:hypothetical protein [uncultured Microbulbifer sp.]|uniref:hypothetical protein n=1 Tax=uncultured Microbulbifer sp. TaxID=348147 RepID=UPI0025D7B996|nr:hypothetical protein [uncultured Microbulbifer sp.]
MDQVAVEQQGDNIADIEAVVAGAETGETEQGQELPEAPKAVEVDPMEKARTKARNIVGALQGVFGFLDKRIKYPEEVYKESETRLAPALAKHQLEESAVLKYSEEADALAFVGELVWRSAADVVGLKQADRAKAEAEAEQAEETIQQGVRPDGDES